MIPAQEEIDGLTVQDFLEKPTAYFVELEAERKRQIQAGFR